LLQVSLPVFGGMSMLMALAAVVYALMLVEHLAPPAKPRAAAGSSELAAVSRHI
jgi:hypothetical protein